MKTLFITTGFVFLYSLMNAQNYDSKWLLASPFDGIQDDQCIQFDFSVNPPKMSFKNSKLHFKDNSISISNDTGKILFYTNGCDILSGEDTLIVSRDSLDLGYTVKDCDGGDPSSQNMVIFPFQEINQYYVFYKNVILEPTYFTCTKLSYTKLKNNLNGKIEVNSINSGFLTGHFSLGQITGTKHANLKDWWLLCWKEKTNQYISVEIKSDTVLQHPPINIGDTISLYGDGVGQSVFSPDGTKYAFTNVDQGVFLFDFDKSSGTLSNFKSYSLTKLPDIKTYGCAFSSNSRFLYICARTLIYQIDTWNPDSIPLIVGEYNGLISSCGNFPPNYFKAQLAPDCRIYIAANNGVSCLTLINYPNLIGKKCEVVNGGLTLPFKIYNFRTLPNHPNYRLGTGEVCDSTLLFPVATNEVLAHFTTAKVFAYPNPFSESLNLLFPENLEVPSRLNLLNISGSLINTINVSPVGNDKHVVIDISNIDKGMYFLNWIDKESGRSYTIKVIKE